MENSSLDCSVSVPGSTLVTLSTLTLQIHQIPVLEELLEFVVRECRTQLQTDWVVVVRLDTQARAAILAESVGPGAVALQEADLTHVGLSADGVDLYRQSPWREIVQVGDSGADAQHRASCVQGQAYLSVPVPVHADLWGVLIAHHSYSPRCWQESDREFLQQVGLHLGIRIQHLIQQQAAETALYRYERIMSAIPDCMSLVDRDYVYQAINQTYVCWNNKTPEEILGQSVRQLLGEPLFEEIKPQLDRCLAGETTSWKDWHTYPGVGRRFVRATYTPYTERDGTVAGVLVNVHDLTDLKQVEETLAESEERFRQMADNIHDVVWMADIDFTQILYISPAFEEVWGLSCASLYDQPQTFLELVHPDDQAQVRANVEHHRRTGFSHEYRLMKPDGSIRWIWEQAFPVLDGDGHPYRLVGISQDITDRKLTEAALQHLNQQLEQRVQERTQALEQQAEQERLLRLCIQNIHRSLDLEDITTTVLSETRRTVQADRVALYQFCPDWSGCFVAESVGEEWVPLVKEGVKTVWEDTYLQEHRGGRYQNHEILVVNDIYTADLSPCHIDILEQFQVKAYITVPIFVDDQLWGLLAAYQNRGARTWRRWERNLLRQISIQLAIALRQAQLYKTAQTQVKELEALNQLKDDFLSTVSHELRSPLTNIKMAIQMVELRLRQHQIQDDHLTQYLQILKGSCSQELSLINDLLDLQRLETGRECLEVERVDLAALLTKLVEPFETRAQDQQQHLNLTLSPQLPPVTTDPNSLSRIVTELLHNACKYTPPHQQISISAWAEHQALYIQVSNSGVEIPPEELPHLFEKFYRVTSVDRWKHGGTGLGLALVKRLVEHLKGSIEVKSEDNLTCFTLHLPLNTYLSAHPFQDMNG